MKLIVGLGNPGDKYAGNRHNIGFMAVDEMARGYSFAPWKKRFQGLTAEGQIGLERCLLLKPSTFMNESGRAVGEAVRFYKISLEDVIVIHDEIDLKPGQIRVKTGGGNAGHNGLRSISAHIGNDYLRVRLGVDHPGDKALVANYVLNDFAKADSAWLIPLLEGVARGMAKLVEGSEAGFLAEAARGRKPASAAPKLNGAAAPKASAEIEAKPKTEAASAAVDIYALAGSDRGALAAVVAAASKPIEPLPAPVVVPAPIRIEAPAPQEEAAPQIETRAKEPAPAEFKPVVEEVVTAPPAAKIVPAPAPKVEPILQPQPAPLQPEPLAKKADAPKAAATKPKAAPPARKKPSNIFAWWWRYRVRGGTYT
jgi:PTH1 family peptidyl-tRNA hydrolase